LEVKTAKLGFVFFLAVVEQQLKNAAEKRLFWVAFLVWGLWRL
jgi:hypothetical protein